MSDRKSAVSFTFPEVISSRSNSYKIGYLLLSSFILLTGLSVEHEGLPLLSAMPELALKAVFLFAICVVSFMAVQGSDPGYIGAIDMDRARKDEEGCELPLETLKLRKPLLADGTLPAGGGDDNATGGPQQLQRRAKPARKHVHHGGANPGSELVFTQEESAEEEASESERSHDAISVLSPPIEVPINVLLGEHVESEASLAAERKREEQFGQHYQYCKHCDLVVPLRSHHCKVCQRCVATFDHHCFVIGTCIGERNHCRFYLFVIINFIGLWFGMETVNSTMHKPGRHSILSSGGQREVEVIISLPSGNLRGNPVAVDRDRDAINYQWAYLVWCFMAIFWWYLLLLLSYQSWLVMTNMTGYECLKGPERVAYLTGTDDCDLPFSRGIFTNLYRFCCVRNSVTACVTNNCGRNTTSNSVGTTTTSSTTSSHIAAHNHNSSLSSSNATAIEVGSSSGTLAQSSGILPASTLATSPVTWSPIIWKKPGPIITDSTDIWKHPWKNKYYSCC